MRFCSVAEPPLRTQFPPVQRHTADNITKWTDKALKDIGFSAEKLLSP